MKELDIESGIGLIEKKRQGQGKPTMIYLKQFMIQDAQKCNNYISGEKSAISEVKNLHVLKCKNVMSRSEEITHPEVKKLHTNKNNINNTELSNTESNHIISGNDGMGFDMEAYTEIIKENIELDILLERYPYDRELLIGIFDLILETVLCKNKSIIVASSEYPAELVRSKFLKLNMFHVEYAMDCMRKNTSKIHNIKKYLLAALFNAPSTISGYYQAEVTNKHLASWKMRKSDFHNFVLEHSLVSMESKIYPLCEKIENVLEGISCCLNNGEAEDSLGYVVTGPGGAASVLYWDTLQELSRLMPDSFYILPYSEREAYILPDTMGALAPAFSIEDVHKNGNRQVRHSLAGYAISSHGFHYSPSENKNKLLTIREWLKGVNE